MRIKGVKEGTVSKKLFAVVSVPALLGVALYPQVDPAVHAQAPPAVTFEWVTVADPGNACDPQGAGRCFGAVGYTYRIATHEVTNAQYAAFLNAKAASDPLGLYNTDMSSTAGGITRSGNPGSHTYSAVPGRGNQPVNHVSYFDALRFANWLHNGQGSGNTETGAYTLLGGTPTPSNPLVARNAAATVFLPIDAEWYKAAYYDTQLAIYYDYPAGTDTLIVCSAPTAESNRANCGGAAGSFTGVGSYTGSPSPNGTFDQGGNVAEWTDMLAGIEENRPTRGGTAGSPADRLRGQVQEYEDPWFESGAIGFRVATLAEGSGGSDCGNSICESTEDPLTCPSDCPDICGDGLCSGLEDALSCPADCPPVCGDGVVQGAEQCEAGVPLGASCTSLGFAGGTLVCTASTCRYDTSGCFNVSCKPKSSRCSKNSDCCSGNCRSGRCK